MKICHSHEMHKRQLKEINLVYPRSIRTKEALIGFFP